MFKYAIVFAALAVSASLAVRVPGHMEQNAEASHFVVHKQHKPEKFVYVAAKEQQQQQQQHSSLEEVGGLLESAVSGLQEVLSLPKKALSAAAGHLFNKLKSVGVKTLLKTALAAGLITVVGAVAAVVASAVAGLVSVLSGVCALALHFRFFLGGGGQENNSGDARESHLDTIGSFVTGAFNKYEMA